MATNAGRGFFRNAFDAMIEARSKVALRHVNAALLLLDDKELAARGYDRATLRRNASASYYL
jgi:hypothetical protein